jgi:hypothetical protein
MTQQNEVKVTTPPGPRRPLPGWVGPTGLAVLAGGIVFGLMRLTWPHPAGTVFQRRLLQTSDLLLALVAAAVVGALLASLRRARDPRVQDPVSVRHRRGLFLGLWALFAIPLVLWWVGEWPGHLYSDVRASLRMSLAYTVDPWLSYLWGIWAHAIHRASGSFPIIGLVNVLIFSALLADFFSLLLHLGLSRRVGGLFIVLVMTSVPLGLLAICMSHDILNGLLRLGVALTLLRVLVRRQLTGGPGVTPLTLPLLAVIITAATLLRGDSMALLLYVPAVLLLTRQVRVGAALALLLVTVGANQAFRRGIEPRLIEWRDEMPYRYAVSLLISPLGFMLQNDYYTRTPQEDREAIHAALTYECMRDRFVMAEPECFWTSLRAPITPEKVAGMRRVFLTAVRDNPGLYLANRVALFVSTLGMEPRGLWPFIHQREAVDPVAFYGPHDPAMMASLGLVHTRAPQAVARVTHWLRDASYPDRGGRFLYFPWNGLPALLLALWLLSSWRTLPVSAALAGAILAPAAAVFLAEPASHPSYVTDLWVFGYLALPLAWFEHKVLRPRHAASRPAA